LFSFKRRLVVTYDLSQGLRWALALFEIHRTVGAYSAPLAAYCFMCHEANGNNKNEGSTSIRFASLLSTVCEELVPNDVMPVR
jgi:cytochrome c553